MNRCNFRNTLRASGNVGKCVIKYPSVIMSVKAHGNISFHPGRNNQYDAAKMLPTMS